MKRGSTLFLKISVIFIGILVLAICLLVLPQIVQVAYEEAQKGALLAYVVFGILLIIYGSVIPFYYALYQTLKLLSYINHNQAFSQISVTALKKIKHCAVGISSSFVLALSLVYVIAEWDDAPGLILIGFIIIGASLVISVFAALLQTLLQEAMKLKEENELTI